jgi:hypothetical protein
MQCVTAAHIVLQVNTWLLLQGGLTALHLAAGSGDSVIVALLLNVGAAVDATNKVNPPWPPASPLSGTLGGRVQLQGT